MPEPTSLHRRLHDLIELCFSPYELQELATAVTGQWTSGGQKLDERITMLIELSERQGRLPALILVCQQLRPQVVWPRVTLAGAPAGSRLPSASPGKILQQQFPDVWTAAVARGLFARQHA